ncbi:MAG: pre-peptidase C-terminal domain-containing protein, partial [Chthoniobacteraceae bacterium]
AVLVNNIGNTANLGFSSYTDAIYRGATFNFTSTGTTSELRFTDGGIQDIGDESWGIDNVKVFKTSDNSLVYSTNFETGAGTEWTSRTVNSDAPGVFSSFLGRFANGGSTLQLPTENATQYRVEFDFYAIDSWDGNAGPDFFDVFAGNTLTFHETFSNYTATNVQSFRAAAGGSVPLQVVPVITSINTDGGRPGADGTFYLTGSGFQEGASAITIGGAGGVVINDNSTADSGGNVYGNNDQYYDLAASLSLEGPIRITTAGGFFEIPGPVNPIPAFVEFSGLNATAAQGTPATAAQASANTGQTITLLGSGFTSSTRVQFDAIDDNGISGIVTRTGTPNTGGTQLTVTVPALAKTGSVRVIGSATTVPLQIVPTLRSVGGALTSGQSIILEGAGLRTGGLTVSIDGQAATVGAGRTISDRGSFDQQVVDVTVPAGVTDGTITVTTPGGTFVLRRAVTVATQPAITPGVEVGDTTGVALTVPLPLNSHVEILGQKIGIDSAFAGKDVDLYRIVLNGGDKLVVDIDRASGSFLNSALRLFNSSGVQLTATNDFGGAGPNFRYTVPTNGTYFVGVSGYANFSYDPAVANSGSNGTQGEYTLKLDRIDGASSVLSGIVGTATSGTAARGGVASANIGQTITINGSGFVAGDRIVFTALGSGGDLSTTTVTPTAIAPDGTNLQVVVPGGATSGQLRLEREGVGLFLQIVPTIRDVTASQGQPYHGANVTFNGSGFVEGNTTILFGGTTVTDLSISNGPDIFYSAEDNGGLNVVVPNGAATGPITVTTLGGTSAPFDLTLTGITAVATSGTPANAGVASANPGQAITLTGTKFDGTTDVIFQTIDGNGTRSERVVRPIAVNGGGTEITVVVPIDVAVTGSVSIAGDRTNTALALQIVPVLTNVDFTSIASDGSSAGVRLRGAGFVEGNGSVYRFGSVAVTDSSPNAGPNTGGFYQYDNDGVDLTLPTGGDDYHGAVTVTTAGGTSAPFSRGFAALTGVALSGTPANEALASANPGQAVTITGAGLSTSTDFISQYLDGNGTLVTRLLNPTTANVAGTSATLIVPTNANGVFALHEVGSANAPLLQIVPTLSYVEVQGNNSARWRGLGFLEGNGTVYSFGGTTTTDSATSSGGGADVGAFYAVDNDGANVAMPTGGLGSGLATIQTSGGTSAAVPWRALNTGLATTLYDVAYEPGTGNLLVATNTEIKRLDAATGATLSSFAMPVQGSGNTGLQIVPAGANLTLNGVAVPDGSLLVTNGAPNPDRVIAVNATTGATIASLALAENIDAVGGLYDAASGFLFILDENPNDVVKVNPATGAVVARYAVPFDVNYGGIALHPTSGNLYVVSSQTSSVVEMTTGGTVVRQLDLAPQGLHNEASGAAFNAAGQLLVSSNNRSVVYRFDLSGPAVVGPAVVSQATITSISGAAGSGTAANGAQASANAGQIVEITGTNFGANTQVIFPGRDQYGNLFQIGVAPLAVNAAGTRLQVQVPALAQTGAVLVNNIGNTANLGFSSYTDAIYRTVTLNFTSTGASTPIVFRDGGIQDINDESWGIDNVRVVRTSDSAVIYSTDFENGAGPEWSDRTTDNSLPGSLTRFLGRFSGPGSSLTAPTVASTDYRLEFDLYAIDSWDGEAGPDAFEVAIDGQQRLHETLSNYSVGSVQTFRAAAGGSVPLQIVPVITSISGQPGTDNSFTLFGSGFMEGASTITIGGAT